MSTDQQLRQPDVPAIQLPPLKLNVPPPQAEECVTPTSPEHRIPATVACPPAPKKPRRVCNRRLREVHFVEIVARDEIDSFFATYFELIEQNSSRKRRCV
ncbi:uncharacterized protein LOC143579228 [Bidens hawaiensis]|uniref:uncharacterized protein LOC143579228 n=1 Tax=Bidens hawaiensis TaxID=980011 RepID=UPI00404A4C27